MSHQKVSRRSNRGENFELSAYVLIVGSDERNDMRTHARQLKTMALVFLGQLSDDRVVSYVRGIAYFAPETSEWYRVKPGELTKLGAMLNDHLGKPLVELVEQDGFPYSEWAHRNGERMVKAPRKWRAER